MNFMEIATATALVAQTAIDELEAWQEALAGMSRQATGSEACWYDLHAQDLSAAALYSRWRIWPSALVRVICLHLKRPYIGVTYRDIVECKECKYVCHALEYMVHGTSYCSPRPRRISASTCMFIVRR